METLISRIVSTSLEAMVAGVAIAGVLVLVRKIQIAAGVGEKIHTAVQTSSPD